MIVDSASGRTPVVRASRIDRAAQRRAGRLWDDAPLRAKVVLLVMLAAVGGAAVGIIEAKHGFVAWPLSIGLSVVIGVVCVWAYRWVLIPFERLIRQIELLAARPQSAGPQGLPVARRDELGRFARAMHRVYVGALRDQHEVEQLRRSLDHRISQATRVATSKLQHLAMRDPLTDLANRRFLDHYFATLFESCQAAGHDLACVVIDVDNFKQVNDTLGHGTGDELLIFLGSLIKACIREADYAVRLGGDEFVVLIPACPRDRVAQLIEQFRTLFRHQVRIVLPEQVRADLSMGVATLMHDHCQSPQQLLKYADANMYAAKAQGKGCTVGI